MFRLSEEFVSKYREQAPAFGWNGLGEVVFYRTYSRDDNPRVNGMETWTDVCERVINGMFLLQEQRIPKNKWDAAKAQSSAQEAFDMMWNMKWTPPGRGLWQMGTPFVMERGVVTALQNCGFISSEFLEEERGDFFRWFMERLMEGVGIGFDTKGATRRITVQRPVSTKTVNIVIEDSREGWAKSVESLYNSWVTPNSPTIQFDYSKIRPKGERINGFGGIASGPEPLRRLHENFEAVLERASKQEAGLSSRDITDLCNFIGTCVIAGNVRRSAEIAFGYPTDTEFMSLKDYTKYPDREPYGWVSNNSIYVYKGQNYAPFAEATWANGEPGYAWMENVHKYGRMNGVPLENDKAVGFNPCGEQPLEHRELCTLVEIYLPKLASKEELKRAVKYAYMYGKTVTLANDLVTDAKSREVMMNNRRIGLSFTGITQFIGKHGYDTYLDWIEAAYNWSGDYDSIYSGWLNIPTSIRRTSVKPSGTVSLVVGVTPGIHFNVASRFHIRRVTLADNHILLGGLAAAGYHIEPSKYDSSSVVVSFPVDAGVGVRSESEVTPEEQLQLVADTMKYGVDNSVSVTVKFDKSKHTPKDIERWLRWSEDKLKDVAFLPLDDHGYEQAPYESITEEQYHAMAQNIRAVNIDTSISLHEEEDKYCDGEACALPGAESEE